MKRGNNKLIIPISSVLFLLAMWFLIGRPVAEKSPFTVKSDDGVVSIEFSKGSLPLNVKTRDIKITKIDSPFGGEKGDAMTYKIEPEIRRLFEPANITLRTDSGPGTDIPLLFLMFKGDAELLNNTSVKIDRDADSLILKAEVNKLDYLELRRTKGLFTFTPNSPEMEHKMGEDFEYRAYFKPSRRTISFNGEGATHTFKIHEGSNWGVSDFALTSKNDRIKPKTATVKGGDNLGPEDILTISNTFKCIAEGFETITPGESAGNSAIVNYKAVKETTSGNNKEYVNLNISQAISFAEPHICSD